MKIIKIKEDHYVVVDDSEIKEGDYCLMFDDYGNLFLGNQPQKYLGERAGHHLNKGLRKITHSTQPLASMKELMEKGYDNILPLDIDEVKELIGEVDVEKKVKEYYEKDTTLNNPSSFKAGYNQALKDNKEKKYTEEDLVKAYEYGSNALLGISKISLIQSLQPKTGWEVQLVDGKLKLK